jgi:uncharacterized protein YneF (UPF0154 family)
MWVESEDSCKFGSLSGSVKSSENICVSASRDEVINFRLELPWRLGGDRSRGSHGIFGELLGVKIFDLILSSTKSLNLNFRGVSGETLEFSTDRFGEESWLASTSSIRFGSSVRIKASSASGGTSTLGAVLVARAEFDVKISNCPRGGSTSGIGVEELNGEGIACVTSDLSLGIPESVVHGLLVAVKLVVGILSPRGYFSSIKIEMDLIVENPLVDESDVSANLDSKVRREVIVDLLDVGLLSENFVSTEQLEVVSSLSDELLGGEPILCDCPSSSSRSGIVLDELSLSQISDGVDSPLRAVLRDGGADEVSLGFHSLKES